MECAARGIGTPCAPGPPTRRCGLCGVVAYCSSSHQRLHWNAHKEECGRLEEQMRQSDLLNDFPFSFPPKVEQGYRLTDEWNLPSSLCPCTEPEHPLSYSLSCWKDYFNWRSLPFHSPVALLLHWPLTIYYSFQILASQGLIRKVKDELRIHYLGAEQELSQIAVFGELRALFPGVQLHVDFVGPAVPQYRDGCALSLGKYLPCLDAGCQCKSSCSTSCAKNLHESPTLTLKLHKGLYHERFKSILKEDSFPHFIIAPNAGVAAYHSWLLTLEVIKEMGIPAIFTDYCEEAANLASSCITAVTRQPLKVPIQINPFRQPMVVEESALYLPCYSNCFLFGM